MNGFVERRYACLAACCGLRLRLFDERVNRCYFALPGMLTECSGGPAQPWILLATAAKGS